MKKLTNLIRADLREFKSYSSARDEATQGKIWLNANESPYPYEVQAGITINRYPEKQPTGMVEKISEVFNLKTNQIVLTRGSDEGIDLLTRLFCQAGKDAIMICTPTYGMYSVSARLQGAKVVEVPLIKKLNFQLDTNAIMSTWNENIKIVFLCSPNNPTGNLLNKNDILYLCKQLSNKSIIVVDEAYIDFSNEKSLSDYIEQYDNLVVLRTFSKAYGLAGARIGFLVANTYLVQWILKIIAPYPLSPVVVNLAYERLFSQELLKIKHQIEGIKIERERLLQTFSTMSFVKTVWPSEANYLLIETIDADQIMTKCATHGIVLRSMFDKIDLVNCIRVSIGLPEENTNLLNVLQDLYRSAG